MGRMLLFSGEPLKWMGIKGHDVSTYSQVEKYIMYTHEDRADEKTKGANC